MSNTPTGDDHRRKWAFDRTLNIPTLITIGSLIVGGISVWNEMTRRVEASERIALMASQEVKRLEAAQSSQAKGQADQLQVLRSEFRNDLRDINSKLDTLLLSSAGARPETKGWTRP